MQLRQEQWLVVVALQMDDDAYDCINIGALDINQLFPEARERITAKAIMDNDYCGICNPVNSGGNVDKQYPMKDRIVCWKYRAYIPGRL